MTNILTKLRKLPSGSQRHLEVISEAIEVIEELHRALRRCAQRREVQKDD